MKWLLRGIAVVITLHVGVALLGASALSFRPDSPAAARAGMLGVLAIIAVLSGWAVLLIWRLRWWGVFAMGITYAALTLLQVRHLLSGGMDFSRTSMLVFLAMALVLLSPQARRACVRASRPGGASEYTP